MEIEVDGTATNPIEVFDDVMVRLYLVSVKGCVSDLPPDRQLTPSVLFSRCPWHFERVVWPFSHFDITHRRPLLASLSYLASIDLHSLAGPSDALDVCILGSTDRSNPDTT